MIVSCSSENQLPKRRAPALMSCESRKTNIEKCASIVSPNPVVLGPTRAGCCCRGMGSLTRGANGSKRWKRTLSHRRAKAQNFFARSEEMKLCVSQTITSQIRESNKTRVGGLSELTQKEIFLRTSDYCLRI